MTARQTAVISAWHDGQILDVPAATRILAAQTLVDALFSDALPADRVELERDFDTRRAALRDRWSVRYTRYLAAFEASVRPRATELGLTVAIEVRGDTDPTTAWESSQAVPSLWDADPLAAQLYDHAVLDADFNLLITDTPDYQQ